MPAALPFDAYDTRILAELQADARITLAELGRRVHLSQPAATERVRKLEAAGVISGYRATVNVAALGYGIRALIRVGRADFARVEALIQQTPEVINAWNVTGEDSWAPGACRALGWACVEAETGLRRGAKHSHTLRMASICNDGSARFQLQPFGPG